MKSFVRWFFTLLCKVIATDGSRVGPGVVGRFVKLQKVVFNKGGT